MQNANCSFLRWCLAHVKWRVLAVIYILWWLVKGAPMRDMPATTRLQNIKWAWRSWQDITMLPYTAHKWCTLDSLFATDYCEPVTFTKTNQYGCGPDGEDDVYTVDEFCEHVVDHSFIDYDGFGYPVRDSKCDPRIVICPSTIDKIPKDATHIVWYNR